MGSINLIALREFNGELQAFKEYRRAFTLELRRLGDMLYREYRDYRHSTPFSADQEYIRTMSQLLDDLYLSRAKFVEDTSDLGYTIDDFIHLCTNMLVVDGKRLQDAVDELRQIKEETRAKQGVR